MTYLFFFVGIGCNAAANYFLKILAASNENLVAAATLKNPLFYAVILLFGGSILFYGMFIQRTNLAVGYPAFVGGTFIIVLALSYFFLRETLTLPQIVGIGLIFSGILLAVR